jgi:hypothetical protein
MFSMSLIDNTRSVNDTSRVVRMTLQLGASLTIVILVTRGVIYDRNIFMMQDTGEVFRTQGKLTKL